MRIGWSPASSYEAGKLWVIRKRNWKGQYEYARRPNGEIARWVSKEAAERYARDLNIREAVA